VRECPLGYNGLARESGIDVAALWRFAQGKTGLGLKNLDVLARFLNLEVVEKDSPEGVRKRGAGKRGAGHGKSGK